MEETNTQTDNAELMPPPESAPETVTSTPNQEGTSYVAANGNGPDTIQVGRTDVLTAKTTYLVSPSLLTIDFALNGRFDEPNKAKVKEYAQSFAQVGQLHPIRAKKVNGGLMVTYGFHRALAGLLGIESGLLPQDWKIRYELDESIDAKGSFLQNVAENFEHEKLTIMDRVAIFHRLTQPEPVGFGMSANEAASKIGEKARFANAATHLLSLPKKYQVHVHRGRISGELGYEVAMAGPKGLEVLNGLLTTKDKVLQIEWREAMREAKEEAKQAVPGTVEGDSVEAGNAVDEAPHRRRAKKKQGAEDRTPKRTMKEVNGIYEEIIAVGKEAPGFVVAKRLLDINLGKGSAKAAKSFVESLVVAGK